MSGPVLIFYHIPDDGDESDIPNAFPIMKQSGGIQLNDIRGKFPLPGTYHFRFKMKWGEGSAVWMDVTNEASQVPQFDGKIIAKVTRISWESDGKASSAKAPATQGGGASAKQAAAPAPPPAPPADALTFDEDPPVRPTAPARQAAAPTRQAAPAAAPKGGHDEFDMLFG